MLRRHERWLALSLAVVWLGGGIAGLLLGIAHAAWSALALGVFALAYGLVWLSVAVRGRLFEPGEWLMAWRGSK
jgi:hypothetical protein